VRDQMRIWGIPIDIVDRKKALDVSKDLINREGLDMIVTPNSEIIMNAVNDKELFDLISSASLVIPDGIGLVYASKIMGSPLHERVTGIDLLNDILNYLQGTGQGVFLLGGKPETLENQSVAELAGENMNIKYPSLRILGTHHGYFSTEEEANIVKKINDSGAQFLCVALGSPKQEKFIFTHKKELVNIKAAIGVGGSLDVWAGTAKRAPRFYRDHGLEWLYRLIKEPWRYKRMAKLPVFMGKIILTKGK